MQKEGAKLLCELACGWCCSLCDCEIFAVAMMRHVAVVFFISVVA